MCSSTPLIIIIIIIIIQLGMVVEQDRERATAVIQLQDNKEVLNAEFDDICQYMGAGAEEDMF